MKRSGRLAVLTAALAALLHLPAPVVADFYFYRWVQPALYEASLVGRDDRIYNPGYPPEFGSCGSGTTCSDACGDGFEACNATTSLSLFCFNKPAGQTCCPNGSGRELPSPPPNQAPAGLADRLRVLFARALQVLVSRATTVPGMRSTAEPTAAEM